MYGLIGIFRIMKFRLMKKKPVLLILLLFRKQKIKNLNSVFKVGFIDINYIRTIYTITIIEHFIYYYFHLLYIHIFILFYFFF